MYQHSHPIDQSSLGQLSCAPSGDPAPALSWRQIVAIEPDIAAVVAEARAIRRPTWVDYAILKASMSKLVGYGARNAQLRSCETYDVAVGLLVETLRL